MAGPFEIPNEMREMAERSVQQARQAFESFTGAIQKSSATMEEAAASASNNMKGMTEKAASFAQENMKAAFDHAEQLVKAKDPQEMLKLQSDYVQKQMAALQTQSQELSEAVKSAAASATGNGKK